jgi:anaerobic magnesium-protoporphyrin IX monomethyl ester cyclase
VVCQITRALRQAQPQIRILYGGVFPSYHWKDILLHEPQIDAIVRGEGEATTLKLIQAWTQDTPLQHVHGIAFRDPHGTPIATPPAPTIANLDDYRIGWELLNFSEYSYWGNQRAVVVQFSRGCPHHCSYCGQRGFWTRWRYRNPARFARELAWLHRQHQVQVINFADENPTANRHAWKAFLEALIAENVPLTLVGSTRADDIVRDADLLHLYKKAGVARFLLGMESTDDATLQRIRKGSTTRTDREAIRLLRQHGILSMAAYVPGFQEASHQDYWRALRQILAYDPDQIQLMYATPHRWTAYYNEVRDTPVVQTDLSRWDYKHQVLANPSLSPFQTILWMKAIEVVAQMRPRALARLLAHPDPAQRAAMRWYYRIGRRVWFHEWWQFLFHDRTREAGPTVEKCLGEPLPDTSPNRLTPSSHLPSPVPPTLPASRFALRSADRRAEREARTRRRSTLHTTALSKSLSVSSAPPARVARKP